MDRVIRPAARLQGVLRVPGDKSVSHRALILGALAPGKTYVRGLAPGLDVQSTRRCLEALGATFAAAQDDEGHDLLAVTGVGFDGLRAPAAPLDCGNSGTTMRLLSGVLAGTGLTVELTGDDSLRRRPMGRVAKHLRAMGARFEFLGDPDRAPFRLIGTARPAAIEASLEVASAQVKSAVLLAGLRADGRTVVREPSRSRDHTERMLRIFGVDVLDEGSEVLLHGPADLERSGVEVPADISSAAFFLCAAAGLPGSRLLLREVGVNPGRTGILEVLRAMGAKVIEREETEMGFEPVCDLFIEGPERLESARVAGALVPRMIDELVVLAVLATRAHGTTEIRDATELRVKESDRIALVARNLEAMGAKVEALPDGLRVEGPAALRGAAIETAGDHRIAMAFAVAALFAEGHTTIHGSECADVSYPGFFEGLEALRG